MLIPNTARWIAIVFFTPFWWALGLFVLALLGDLSRRFRPRVSRLFDLLDRTRLEPPNEPAYSSAATA